MRLNRRSLLALALIAMLVASCTTSTSYWIPPSAPPGALVSLDYVTPVGNPQLAAGNLQAPPAANQTTEDGVPPVAVLVDPQPEASDPQPASSNQDSEIRGQQSGGSDQQSTARAQQSSINNQQSTILYYAQAADTLPTVAVRFGVQPDEITSPDPIPQTTFINPGQLLVIPARLGSTTSTQKLMPDSEVVFSPSAADFDIAAYLAQAGGKLRSYHEWLRSSGLISGAQVVMQVASENSVNPRLLLALLEYQGGWVTDNPSDPQALNYPMGYVSETDKGLYNQLVWAVNHLNTGYYAYREGRLTDIQFADGSSIRLAPDLNAGTVALLYFFAQLHQGQDWLDVLDPQTGFPAVHARMFGDPWERARGVEPLFPPGIAQPPLSLPFMRNWVWAYTGGPHGAWEKEGSYAAIDFAPGNVRGGCVASETWAVASAPGLIVRTGKGLIVLDLDGDGREQTGWVLIYLHLASDGKLPVGTWVDADDPLGKPSCEGGMSTGTHLHIARKYNGEWIPADGPLPFNLGGWIAHAGEAPYKGTLTRDGQTVTACTCSNAASFVTRGPQDP
jgi:murein DD-endopeptidase MepM/ murein hydrolase activator NlpD